jgi:hypothetical protein
MPRDAEVPNNRVVQRHENLDVVRTSRDQERARKNFDIRETSQEQKNCNSVARTSLVAEKVALICYRPQPFSASEQHQKRVARRYRVGGTTLISLPQAINFKAAVDFAASVGTPLTAHCIIHWVGTDAGDDPTGELFAQFRETLSLWLRRRGVRFAAVWAREKLSGGQAEVEHAHLLFHLPDTWLKGAKLVSVNGGVQGGVELLQLEAALCRIVRGCAGWLDHYAVKLKIPTECGNPGPYNGRSYDGLYLLKGGGKQAWKLFPRIKRVWRRPQGVIFGKRCGCTQNLGPADRHRAGYGDEYDLWQRARDLKLRLR